ncbi:MAG TPA: DNA replication/repair protein RecF [Caulobacteraceae bacterium]|jgi:DNA replication and repair protein RecF
MRSRLTRISLADFRSYDRVELELDGASAFLFGPNGAGKTNFLEAVSFFSPGRGLRGAALAEVGRRLPGESEGAAWAVSADVAAGDASIRIGTGVESAEAARRVARVAGEPAAVAAFAQHLRPIWLTPAHDRLFLDGASERRRFLDRLVFTAAPGHASDVASYERAQRERMRLLTAGPSDPAWLDALEAQAARAGARVAAARAQAVAALAGEIGARDEGAFPAAIIRLTGEWEQLAGDGMAIDEIGSRLSAALAQSRSRDAAAGRALRGPHRTDLTVMHRQQGRPAAQCSTGEQKALILNLILAQAGRLSRANSAPNPILLLDEVAAHLDQARRAALFDEIEALSLQAFLTGTDEALFETLKGRALRVRVDASNLTVLDP